MQNFLIDKILKYSQFNAIHNNLTFQPEDPIEVRWAHLALLVDFAFDLKKALQGINEQSFNHFVLKMGMYIVYRKIIIFISFDVKYIRKKIWF